jgi:flagellar FliL protein
MAASAASTPGETPAKGGIRRFALPLVLLLGGAGGGYAVSQFLAPEPAPEGESADAEVAPEEGGHSEPKKDAKAEGGGHGGDAKPAEGGGHGGGAEGDAPKPKGAREVFDLGPFTTNLRGAGGGRVLRTQVQVEIRSQDIEFVTERKAMMRDSVLTLVSDYSYADLEGVDGKTHLRDELQGRLNAVLGGDKVLRVYFTEMVVQ